MQTPVRRAELTLLYDNVDISMDVSRDLVSFEYNDVMDGRYIDDIAVVLEDREGRWRSEWFPEHGATLTAKLTCMDWPGGMVLDCGKFEIDDIQFAGRPSTFTVRALAAGISTSLRRELVNRAWENVTVQEIAQEIAGKHGFELVYDCQTEQVKIDRYDQRDQSDLQMLCDIAEERGLGVKVGDGKIILFEQLFYESQEPQITLVYENRDDESYSFRLPTADVYSSCAIQYLDPKQRILLDYTYEATASDWSGRKPRSGYILKIKDRCSCKAEAEVKARAALRAKNKQEITGHVDQLGNPQIYAGMVVKLEGYGRVDAGKYLLEKVSHIYDKQGGYTTTAHLRGVLKF